MRRPISFVAFLSLAFATLASVPAAEQVPWLADLDEAFRVARKQNRPILIHFWSPDCVPCRQLEENVFNRPSVSKTLGDLFVPVKVNAKQHPQLASRYDIRSVPWDVIVTPGDKELHRMLTPQDPQRYVAQLSATAFRAGMVPRRNRDDRFGRPESTTSYDSRLGPPPGTAIPPRSTQIVAAYDVAPPDLPPREADRQDPEAQEVINRFARQNSTDDRMDAYRRQNDARPYDRPHATAPGNDWETRGGPPAAEFGKQAQTRDGPEPSPPANNLGNGRPSHVQQAYGGENLAASTPSDRQSPTFNRKGRAVEPESRTSRAPVGMDGYCPVTLLKKDVWRKGDRRFGIIHRGRTYLFAGSDERELFSSNPDDYSPVLAGIDPVLLADSGEAAEGNRAHGVVYRERVFLFTTEENLQRFWQQPERYAGPIRQAMEAGTVNRLFR